MLRFFCTWFYDLGSNGASAIGNEPEPQSLAIVKRETANVKREIIQANARQSSHTYQLTRCLVASSSSIGAGV